MPGDCPVGMLKLRFDWYITRTDCHTPGIFMSFSSVFVSLKNAVVDDVDLCSQLWNCTMIAYDFSQSKSAVNQDDQNFKDRNLRCHFSSIGNFKNSTFVSHDYFYAVFLLGYWGREGLSSKQNILTRSIFFLVRIFFQACYWKLCFVKNCIKAVFDK